MREKLLAYKLKLFANAYNVSLYFLLFRHSQLSYIYLLMNSLPRISAGTGSSKPTFRVRCTVCVSKDSLGLLSHCHKCYLGRGRTGGWVGRPFFTGSTRAYPTDRGCSKSWQFHSLRIVSLWSQVVCAWRVKVDPVSGPEFFLLVNSFGESKWKKILCFLFFLEKPQNKWRSGKSVIKQNYCESL